MPALPPSRFTLTSLAGTAALAALILGGAGTPARGQVQLTVLRHWQLTPNAQDSSGVFCRVFHHPARDRFYALYAGRAGAAAGPQTWFRWREYTRDFVFTGRSGVLPGFGSNVGDYAMTMVDSTYFHVTAGATHTYKLSRFDDDFLPHGATSFALDNADASPDMLMNYVDGRLVIGALHQAGTFHPTLAMMTPSWTPVMHRWEYGLDLSPLGTPGYLAPTFYAWGGSCVSRNGRQIIVCHDSFPAYNLRAYEFDSGWNYLGSSPLSIDGQWSQGLLWDGQYFYVAWHSGRQHNAGNIAVGVFDINWNPVYSALITNYAVYVPQVSPPLGTRQENANRPCLTRVGSRLYVAYDVDGYVLNQFPSFFLMDKKWQAHVMELQIETVGGAPPPGTVPAARPRLRVTPNPAGASARLEADAPLERVEVVDVYGRVVRSETGPAADRPLDLRALPRGVYIVRAHLAGGDILTQKLVRS